MKIILFDGVCNFCNSTVNFILKQNKDKVFHFAALQSETGKELLVKNGKLSNHLSSIIFIDEDLFLEGTDAVIGILKYLKGYKFIYHIIRLIPRKFSNMLYVFVAKNRYQWFGKRETCRVPNEKDKEVFFK